MARVTRGKGEEGKEGESQSKCGDGSAVQSTSCSIRVPYKRLTRAGTPVPIRFDTHFWALNTAHAQEQF